MEWVDSLGSRNSKGSRARMDMSDLLMLREQLELAEAKLKLVEDIRDLEIKKNADLSNELAQDKKKIECLSKCLKGFVIMFFIWFVFVWLPLGE